MAERQLAGTATSFLALSGPRHVPHGGFSKAPLHPSFSRTNGSRPARPAFEQNWVASGGSKYRLFDSKSDTLAAPRDVAPVGVSDDRPETLQLSSEPDRVPTGGGVPDGNYDCKLWSGSNYVDLGTVRSVDGSLDTGALAKVGATFTGAKATAEGITVSYTTARGNRESMDCSRLP